MNWQEHKPEEFSYRGKWIYNWFSNMEITPLIIDGVQWPSVENYFQAQKSIEPTVQYSFRKVTPSESKRLGRSVLLRQDWEQIKESVMEKALRIKFSRDPWKSQLKATGDSQIIEWNNWNDKIWGVSIYDNVGENKLGLLLMKIRSEL